MKIIKRVLQHLKNNKGNSAIFFLITSTLLIGSLAFVVDAGMMYLEKTRIQDAADSIALAAMQDYPKGETAMLEQANRYAGLYKIDPANFQVTFADNDKKITVVTKKDVPLYFAKIFNQSNAVLQAKASAAIGAIVETDGLTPFAVEQQTFEYGVTYTLKKGAGEAYTGNYGALALGGTGSDNYRNNLEYGYHGDLSIGDMVAVGEDLTTETGNMAGPTYDGIKYLMDHDTSANHDDLTKLEKNCPRLIVIPVVDSLSVEGRTTVKIVGFTTFFLEETIYEGGQTEVKGKFIPTLGQGKIDETATDYGMLGVKLVE